MFTQMKHFDTWDYDRVVSEIEKKFWGRQHDRAVYEQLAEEIQEVESLLPFNPWERIEVAAYRKAPGKHGSCGVYGADLSYESENGVFRAVGEIDGFYIGIRTTGNGRIGGTLRHELAHAKDFWINGRTSEDNPDFVRYCEELDADRNPF